MSLVDNWDDEGAYDGGGGYGGDVDESMMDSQPFPLSPARRTAVKPDKQQIFSFRRLRLEKEGLLALAVANGTCVLAFEALKVARFHLNKDTHAIDGEVEVVEIARKADDSIRNLFLHPSGYQLIVTLRSGENYMLLGNSKKPRLLRTPKGVSFLSVAWDKPSTSSTTREFLVGTQNGCIYKSNQDAKEFKLVYQLNESMPITGLAYELFPDQAKYFVMATTPTRIYQFIGEPPFEALFDEYRLNPAFHELPGRLASSEMHFFSKYNGLAKSFAWLTPPGMYHGNLVFGSQNVGDSVTTDATLIPYPPLDEAGGPDLPLSLAVTEFHFILLTAAGHVMGICKVNEELVLQETLGKQHFGGVRHLARDPVENSIWLLTDTGIFEIVISEEGRNMWHIFLQKEKFEEALKYCRTEEQRARVLMVQADAFFEKGKYELSAACYAATGKHFEEVALQFIHAGRRDALKTYLLEKLKTFRAGDKTQLTLLCTWLTEIYLDKLNELAGSGVVGPSASAAAAPGCGDGDVEGPSPVLGELGGAGGAAERAERAEQERQRAQTAQQERAKEQMLAEEFKVFLADYKDDLDSKTTFSLLASHGRMDLLLFYATLIEDYERVISHYLQAAQFVKALDIVRRQSSAEIYYKFSPALMRAVPYELVAAWLAVDKHFLDPRKLLPALMEYDPTRPGHLGPTGQNQAIRYLQHCISHLSNTDATVHNYLVLLYAQHPDEKLILSFLNSQQQHPVYDVKYALRMCRRYNKLAACCYIYGVMSLFEEAVELALQARDYALARELADRPLGDDELRRKLWLRIARAMIEDGRADAEREGAAEPVETAGAPKSADGVESADGEGGEMRVRGPEEAGIQQAIAFIAQSGDLLKIEDILPFFPSSVQIDDFKEEICGSLEQYNRHIEELKSEMDGATRSADLIRADITRLRTRHGVIPARKPCASCGRPVLSAAFLLFPCQHVFHSSCVANLLLQDSGSGGVGASGVLQTRVRDLLAKIKAEEASPSPPPAAATPAAAQQGVGDGAGSVGGDAAAGAGTAAAGGDEDAGGAAAQPLVIETLRARLNDLLGAECPLCGDLLVDSVARPFIASGEADLRRSWEL